MGGKRDQPTSLKKILELDITATNKFCSWANNFTALKTLRNHATGLEISCHGIPWLCCVLMLMWFSSNPETQHMAINLLLGLILDIVLVAVIKSATRRRRPAANPNEGSVMMIGPDKFSFPSGHASRVVFLACFFIHLWPLSIIFYPPLVAWATAVSISRVLMRRHHLLDVGAGIFLGLTEALLMSLLWISESWAEYIYSKLSDEAQEGSSFDV
ncbi:polyisoprenoid diphosphate/phosphate phosphohydrolase PLPP6 [Neocloeon triangulifer]|uniref:polyisoprenoid diphosphate/phosphate phosphohydrolase PLPP6 n=1 Tax=Neocloeon triangulifer TaxID=2078957 RepID=UPI00286F1E05|nr:polyisoprenoid diphosphate/phosphate phosphohydrolase PLPP6 [Neocloeon triangulifer]